MKIITSKDKEKVRMWAKKQGRKILWKDEKDIWHAATNEENVSVYAVEKEKV